MASSHTSAADASPARPFVTTAYTLDGEDGSCLRPCVLPTTCLVAGETSDPAACVIRAHQFRARKTGPCFPVAVLRCAVHRRYFTLYPLGHRPYGRVALAPVFADGEPRRSDEPVGANPGAGEDLSPRGATASAPAPRALRRLVWSATLFAAAFDAAAGRGWPREAVGETVSLALRETQLRRLDEAARMLGIAPAATAPRGERIALRLGVPRLALLSASDAYRDAPTYVARGQVLRSVLDRIPPDRCLVDRFLAVGAMSGCWGTVSRWVPAPSTAGASAGPRRVRFPTGGAA